MADSVNNFSHDPEPSLEAGDAVSAVFGVTELLLLIVSAVPLEERTWIRRVSKSWQAAIERVGHALEPIGYHQCRFGGTWVGFEPAYQTQYYMSFNVRCLGSRRYPAQAASPSFKTSVTTESLNLSKMEDTTKCRRKFITIPPITQVVMSARSGEDGAFEDGRVAILRVRGGIRVEDVLEYFKKLKLVPSHPENFIGYAEVFSSNC
jgi:hypothetical protein